MNNIACSHVHVSNGRNITVQMNRVVTSEAGAVSEQTFKNKDSGTLAVPAEGESIFECDIGFAAALRRGFAGGVQAAGGEPVFPPNNQRRESDELGSRNIFRSG